MSVLTDREFDSLINFININYGNNLSQNKAFVELRIQKLMAESGYLNFADYFDYICSDLTGVAISNLISSLTINHTLFNREPNHFQFLVNEVLPEIQRKEALNRDLRIWSAGCATGEEPYTLAMLLADYFGSMKPFWDTRIFACDISMVALKKALAGVYSLESIKSLEPKWLNRYFTRIPGDEHHVTVSDEIKKEVIFKRMNLSADTFTFKKKFHCIFCRNVMIYFDEDTKLKLVQKFYECLEPGGYLFIGSTESLQKDKVDFKYVMPSVYRKE